MSVRPVEIGWIETISGDVARGCVALNKGVPFRPLVLAIVSGKVVGYARPETLRGEQERLDCTIELWDFTIDLGALDQFSRPCTVEFALSTNGLPLHGSPVRLDALSMGHIDSWNGGLLVGWAYDPRNSTAYIDGFSGDEFLFSWPCTVNREDLQDAGIRSVSHGFEIPLSHLTRSPPQDLRFRIAGTQHFLEPPQRQEGVGGGWSDYVGSFADAKQARNALLAALAGGKVDDGRLVKLSFDCLQYLLDRLSAAENRLTDEIELDKLFGAAEGDARGSDPTVDRVLTEMALLAEPEDTGNLVEITRNKIVPAWASFPERRTAIENSLLASRSSQCAHAAAIALRSCDFMRPAAAAYEAGLRLAGRATPHQVRTLTELRSWAGYGNFDFSDAASPIVGLRSPKRQALYVLWRSLPYDTTGYATRSHYLLRELQRIGADVIAVTRLGYPWDAEKRLPARAMIECIDGITYVHLGGLTASRETMGLDAYIRECADRIAQIALIFGADIIHSASNWLAGLPALIAARKIRVPFAYEVRGLWEIARACNNPGYEKSDHYALFERMETCVAAKSDIVFSITRQIAAELRRRGVDRNDIIVVPNGFDSQRFVPAEKDQSLRRRFGIGEEIVLGFIGTFAAYEGLIDLCHACVRLRARGKRFRLLLVGDGPDFEKLQEFAHGELSEELIMVGRVPFNEAPAYYTLLDLAVFPRLPTLITDLVSPLKPFEAMAMAKPIIASNVDALADIVQDGETGWLFPKGDIRALENLLIGAIDNPARLTEAGGKARAWAEKNLTWHASASSILNGWDKLRANSIHNSDD